MAGSSGHSKFALFGGAQLAHVIAKAGEIAVGPMGEGRAPHGRSRLAVIGSA